MSKVIATLKSSRGVMTLYENKVEIESKGIAKFFSQGIRNVQLDSISEVEYSKAGFTLGYIRLIISGNRNNEMYSGGLLAGVQNAQKDPNTIMFDKKFNSDALAFKEKIEELIVSRRKGAAGVVVNEVSKADELKKFKELLDSGVINEDEFQAKKRQILDL